MFVTVVLNLDKDCLKQNMCTDQCHNKTTLVFIFMSLLVYIFEKTSGTISRANIPHFGGLRNTTYTQVTCYITT